MYLRTFEPFSILENKRKHENEDINMEKVYFLKNKKNIPKFENQNINEAIQNDNNDNINNDNSNNDNNDNDDKDELKKNQKEEIDNINFEEKQMNKYFDINYNNIPGINKLLKDGYDIKILKKGECYGIYNLLNNQPYNLNAIALENTDIFYLEKEHFDKYLLTPISRIDLERKYIINKLIPSVPMELISTIQPEFYDNNHIIYTEFDYAFECFYIYKGSAELKKYPTAKNKNDIYEHKNILKTISKIDEGGIAGLEICKGPHSFYDNTLMITDSNTIIYRINVLYLKGKKHTTRNNIKQFFTKLYGQQKAFLQRAEEKNLLYNEIYKLTQKIEKPKFNYSNYFNSIFKDVNPPNKQKRNHLPQSQYQFQKLKLDSANNSNQKIKFNMISTFYNNKTLNNSRYKTIDTQKRNTKSNLFSLFSNKDKKKLSIIPRKMSRNDEEKDMPIFNSFNIYNSLFSSSKTKNQNQMVTISQDSKLIPNNDNNINVKINNIKSVIFGKETQKSNDLSFPKLYKNNSTKNKKKILMRKIQKQNKFNSMDKCLYDTGDFQIPFVTLSDSKNIKKMKNLTYYAKLKKIILNKKLLC